jgi:hypothetical protein
MILVSKRAKIFHALDRRPLSPSNKSLMSLLVYCATAFSFICFCNRNNVVLLRMRRAQKQREKKMLSVVLRVRAFNFRMT